MTNQGYEKMLSMTKHQGNVNQNHNEIAPHTCLHGHHQKKKKTQIAKVDEDSEKREPLYTVGGNANWCSQCWRTVWRFLKNLKIELPYTQQFHSWVYIQKKQKH